LGTYRKGVRSIFRERKRGLTFIPSSHWSPAILISAPRFPDSLVSFRFPSSQTLFLLSTRAGTK
jgi:hypothetical protein